MLFEKDHDTPISQVEKYINQNKHLSEILSAKEMEANGVILAR
jgi:hypothetical protein